MYFMVETRCNRKLTWERLAVFKPVYKQVQTVRRFLWFFYRTCIEIVDAEAAEQTAKLKAVLYANRHADSELREYRRTGSCRHPRIRVVRVTVTKLGEKRHVIWLNERYLGGTGPFHG